MLPGLAVSDQAFPALNRATERHVRWAYDYIGVGDFESAIEALQDARASQAERGVGEPDVRSAVLARAPRPRL